MRRKSSKDLAIRRGETYTPSVDWKAKLRRVEKRYQASKREREETIVGASRAGLTRREVAAELGVDHSLVQQIVKKHTAAES